MHSIQKIGENKYNFFVDIFYENSSIERYQTEMNVIDDKIKTISTQRIDIIILEEKSYKDYYAYVKWENGNSYLYIRILGEDILIEKSFYGEFNDIMSYGDDLGNLNFIGNGQILQYQSGVSTNFYIIESGKIIYSNGIVSLSGFTLNQKYFYLCGLNGVMGSKQFKIYETEKWNIIKDFKGEESRFSIYGCKEYDSINNKLHLYMKGKNDINYENYIFDFKSMNLIENK